MHKYLLNITFVVFLTVIISACNDHNEYESGDLRINSGAEFLSLDHQSHTGQINIKSPDDWTLSTDAQWLKVSAKRGRAGNTNITITLQQNPSAARFTTLHFANGSTQLDFVVSQSAANANFESPTHYFYITFGTLPTLYAGLFMLANNKPSYFYYERRQTFNPAKLPAHVTVAQYDDSEQDKMRDYMKQQIIEINRKDPTAVFALMVDDLRPRIGYDWFVGQGIDSSRVKVTMLSDGTATYNDFYNTFGSQATAEANWNMCVAQITALNWNHKGRYPVTRVLPEFDARNWAFYLSTRPNYRALMQHFALLETDSPFIKDQTAHMDVLNLAPYTLLSQLSEADRDRFYEMAEFDHTKFAQMFEESSKPNLIIIGTTGMPTEQHTYTEKIYTQYGATHNIFFKPHPADKSSANYETEFAGMKLLPGQMPFEIFVWSLLDKIDIIGGFPSTVFLTTPIQKVKFIFAPNSQTLVRPLNLLFADAHDLEWIQ